VVCVVGGKGRGGTTTKHVLEAARNGKEGFLGGGGCTAKHPGE